MTSFKRRQAKYVKKPYRVRNWAEYEAGLRNRGSLTVWIDIDTVTGTIPGWNARKPARRKPGRQKKYSDRAIETALRIGRPTSASTRSCRSISCRPARPDAGRRAVDDRASYGATQ